MSRTDVFVTREGGWWMVAVPEVDGLTQVLTLGDAGQAGRELIALETGADLSSSRQPPAKVRPPNLPNFGTLGWLVHTRGSTLVYARPTSATST